MLGTAIGVTTCVLMAEQMLTIVIITIQFFVITLLTQPQGQL